MLSKKLIGVIIAKVSLLTVLSSAYVTYQFHEPIKRVAGNLLRRDVQVERGFFRDPNGLYVDDIINEDGKKEVYLVHAPTGKKIAVLEDMCTSTEEMLESVLLRCGGMGSGEAKRYLVGLNKIEDVLYRRLE